MIDEKCKLRKCSTCFHNGCCDLQDDLEYEDEDEWEKALKESRKKANE